MIDIAEFRGYLKIDKLNLDREVGQQAVLLEEVSDAYTEASAKRDFLKESLAMIDAKLDFEIRQSLECDSVKATEAMVKNLVLTDQVHKAAVTKYLQAKAEADRLGALKDAFKERGYMLRDMCQLFLAAYFERNSVEDTSATSEAKYRVRRERMAAARGAK